MTTNEIKQGKPLSPTAQKVMNTTVAIAPRMEAIFITFWAVGESGFPCLISLVVIVAPLWF